MLGQTVSHYRILEKLGEGGMGVVYRANDSRLGRDVALKVIHPEVLGDKDRVSRFEEEAKAASALNHPNIVSVYDVGESDGQPYIVYELVEGGSLREALERGAIPTRKLLDLAVQIADGVAAAHTAGIVHRDLKPENLMLTREGRVKIVDFGLARVEPVKYRGDNEPTMTHLQTAPGVVVGTVAYMSPEQACGRTVDLRSDQFALGLILYEMTTGEQAFSGSSMSELLAAILRDEPEPVAKLNPKAPVPLRWIIRRCLAKDPIDRYASTTDIYVTLKDLQDNLSESLHSGEAAVSPAVPLTRPVWLISLLLLAAVTVAAGIGYMMRSPTLLDFSEYRLTPFSTEAGPESLGSFSPDGQLIAYSATVNGVLQILIRGLDLVEPNQLTRGNMECSRPFWSPDGSRVYYESGGDLWSVSVAGGEPQLEVGKARSGSVTPDGQKLAFLRAAEGTDALWFAPLGGETEIRYSRSPLPNRFQWLSSAGFSPDGSKLGLLLVNLEGAAHKPEFWIVPWQEGEPRLVLREALKGEPEARPSWMPDSRHVVFSTGQRMYIGDTDTDTARVILVTPQFMMSPVASPAGGIIAFNTGQPDFDIVEITLDDPGYRPLLHTSRYERGLSWMPTGEEYAYTVSSGEKLDIWIRRTGDAWARPFRPLDPGTENGEVLHLMPRVSPDGRRVAYLVYDGELRIWVSSISGGKAICVDPNTHLQDYPSWSPDSQWIAYTRQGEASRQLVKAQPGNAPIVLAEIQERTCESPVGCHLIDWSPTGEWIAFMAVDGIHLIGPDGENDRLLGSVAAAFGFARDGNSLLLVRQNENHEWEVVQLSVPDGRELQVSGLNLSADLQVMDFSLHPDGDRFATTVGSYEYDIWLLEGYHER